MWHGQFETDRVIASYFDSDFVGSCVEVGAADGVRGSNTLHFEERGWKTLCIEPNPSYRVSLATHRKHFVQVACGEREAEQAEFTVFEIGRNHIFSSISGLVPDDRLIRDHAQLIHKRKIIHVRVRRLDNVLEESGLFSKNIHFISIDTENTELDTLRGIDLLEWDVPLLVVENNYDDPYVPRYLEKFGYHRDQRYEINDFYVKGRTDDGEDDMQDQRGTAD